MSLCFAHQQIGIGSIRATAAKRNTVEEVRRSVQRGGVDSVCGINLNSIYKDKRRRNGDHRVLSKERGYDQGERARSKLRLVAL